MQQIVIDVTKTRVIKFKIRGTTAEGSVITAPNVFTFDIFCGPMQLIKNVNTVGNLGGLELKVPFNTDIKFFETANCDIGIEYGLFTESSCTAPYLTGLTLSTIVSVDKPTVYNVEIDTSTPTLVAQVVIVCGFYTLDGIKRETKSTKLIYEVCGLEST